MKIKVVAEKRGYFLSEKQYEEIQLLEVDDKILYYIPAKQRSPPINLDKDEVLEQLRNSPCKKECSLRFGVEEKQLNNFLKSKFKTISVKAILARL